MQLESSRAHPFYHHIVLVKKYLQRKECGTIKQRTSRLTSLSQYQDHQTFYCKSDIQDFKTYLWREHLTLDADKKLRDTINHTRFTSVTVDPQNHKILFPRTSKRITDTKIMDLIHGHSLNFASFSYSVGASIHPNCDMCNVKDDNLHQLLLCPKYNCSYRDSLIALARDSPSVPLSIILEAEKKQVICFRNIAQIIL